MTISVDTEALHGRSGEIAAVSGELESCMQQIENVVLSIGSQWQGDAERAYTAKLLMLRQQYAGMTAFLNEYAALLTDFSERYEAYDRELSEKINFI